jgi:hypothetical protein
MFWRPTLFLIILFGISGLILVVTAKPKFGGGMPKAFIVGWVLLASSIGERSCFWQSGK